MQDLINELQKTVDTEIAPAHAMQFQIEGYDGRAIKVSAPLQANLNHHGTVFGGSQYAIAAVAGWALLRCKLAEHELQGSIVVKSAGMDYLRPVSSEVFTIAVWLKDEDAVQEAMDNLRDCQRASFTVNGEILQAEKRAAFYHGEYAVRR